MVGNKILENLDGCHPRLPLISYACFAAYTHDHLIMMHAVDEVAERIRKDFCIGINLDEDGLGEEFKQEFTTNHETDFEKVRRHPHENMNFAEKVKVERCHAVIERNPRKEIHQDELTVSLPPVSGFFVVGFCFHTTLDDNYSWRTTTRDR